MQRKAVTESKGIFYAVMTVLGFLAVILLAIGGMFLYHTKGDFYSAFRGEISRGFYYSAGLLLLFSTVLFTPFSYGITHYFLLSVQGENPRFGAVFFAFRSPRLLSKATAVALLKKGAIWLERLAVLLAAASAEVLLFFFSLLLSGTDLLSVHENPFLLAADFMLGSDWMIGLSIALWSLVLVAFFVISLRYILCKYVLLRYPEASVWQALRVGRLSIRGNVLRTFFFYLSYAAFCILTVFSFGLSARVGAAERRSFSLYASRLVQSGWERYCRKRSLRD